jgi:hypothetical protein
MESATAKIRCRFVVVDFFATDLSVADLAATNNPLLVASFANPLLIVSNGFSVASFVNQQRILRC